MRDIKVEAFLEKLPNSDENILTVKVNSGNKQIVYDHEAKNIRDIEEGLIVSIRAAFKDLFEKELFPPIN